MRKLLLVGIVIFLLLSLMTMTNCTSSDIYVAVDDPSIKIELKQDGTFSFWDADEKVYYGAWQSYDSNITFLLSTGVGYEGELQGNTLELGKSFRGQTVFVKK